MTELFNAAEIKSRAPRECRTSGELGHYLRTWPEHEQTLFVYNERAWDKTWEHCNPVLVVDLETTRYDYKGFTHRSEARGLTRVHKIRDNPICPTIRNYLSQGYIVRVFVAADSSRHPDTCAIYAFKERTLLEDKDDY